MIRPNLYPKIEDFWVNLQIVIKNPYPRKFFDMEQLKHECGIVLIRLRKPLSYYKEKYGTWQYGLNKLYLMMEKQHNRGQEGAGLACVKLNAPVGSEYLFRERAIGATAIQEVFDTVHHTIENCSEANELTDEYIERELPFACECYMGHLRYSTTAKTGLKYVHPIIRRDNWRAKSLALCGNFNLTTVQAIFDDITSKGQHPRDTSDMHIMIEQIGHRLDREVEHKFREAKALNLEGMDITEYIEDRIDMTQPLLDCSKLWDGGYVMCGINGSGEMFATRDPWGIRPAFYYYDDEIIVVASERPVIQTVMNLTYDKVQELKRGQAITIDRSGKNIKLHQIIEPKENKACSFERIYFSRGSDYDIYRERKKLGENLVPKILEKVDRDLEHTVFSFIPNTAEVAYYGMMEGLDNYLNDQKIREIENLKSPTRDQIQSILARRIRNEKVAIKDIKLRTFISEDSSRNDLAAHVYDVTYGSIERGKDNLVVIDDSIVRGTTLKESIIKILNRLGPKKIVIVSSSPQIRYPDYYGINMNKMKEFVVFRAAIELLKERGMADQIMSIYAKAKEGVLSGECYTTNFVREIYAPFSVEELNQKMVELMKPEEVKCDVELVFQSIEGLHEAIPNNPGDWYFTGDFPTPGGMKLVNQAYIDYIEKDYTA